MVICVLLPRFELAVAAGGRAALAQGPMALAPEPGREQQVGEVSSAAEALGVHRGMRLGEALARAPLLALVPPDPVGVADAWEKVLAAAGGGRRGGRERARRAPPASRRAACGACTAARSTAPSTRPARALRVPARIGAGPLALLRAGGRRRARARAAPEVVRGAPRPARRAGRAAAPPRATSRTSRARSSSSGSRRSASSPRCRAAPSPTASARPACSPTSWPAARTRRCARACPASCSRRRWSWRSRPPARSSSARSSCSSTGCSRAASGAGARCASVVLSATLVEGGTWRERVVFREPLADPLRMRLALGAAPAALPAPAESAAPERRAPRPAARAAQRALFEDARRARARACARRSARHAPPPGPRPRCACSRSTRTRACPSAASCSRRSSLMRAGPAPRRLARAASRARPRRPAAGGRSTSTATTVEAVRESWLDRGSLVDRAAAAAALLGGRDGRRPGRGGLPRPRRGWLVPSPLIRRFVTLPRWRRDCREPDLAPVRAQAGQSTVEYGALLLDRARAVRGRRSRRPATGLADAVVAQMTPCDVSRDRTRLRRASAIEPCVTSSSPGCREVQRANRLSCVSRVRAARSANGDRTAGRRDHADRACGRGVQASVGGGVALGRLSLGGFARRHGRGLRSVMDACGACRAMRPPTRCCARSRAETARRNPRATGSMALGLGNVPRPLPPDETFGEKGLAAALEAKLGKAGIELARAGPGGFAGRSRRAGCGR